MVVDDDDVDVDEDEDAGSEVWSNEDLISSPIVCDRSLERILSHSSKNSFSIPSDLIEFRAKLGLYIDQWMETCGYH